jgi:hypothetical protein
MNKLTVLEMLRILAELVAQGKGEYEIGVEFEYSLMGSYEVNDEPKCVEFVGKP